MMKPGAAMLRALLRWGGCSRYCEDMAEAIDLKFESDPSAIFLEEDEETLAKLDCRIEEADAGLLVSMEEVRNRMKQWATESTLLKVR